MQKWEYCHVSFGDVVQHVVSMRADEVSYQTIPHEADLHSPGGLSVLYRTIATLGADGWEMVSVTRSESADAETVWMKRPLP